MIIRITFLVVFISSVLVRKTSLFKTDNTNVDIAEESSTASGAEDSVEDGGGDGAGVGVEECWENVFGNELYKLYIFQVLLSFGFNTIIFEYVVTMVAKTFR